MTFDIVISVNLTLDHHNTISHLAKEQVIKPYRKYLRKPDNICNMIADQSKTLISYHITTTVKEKRKENIQLPAKLELNN